MADTPAGPITVWVSDAGVRHIEFGPLPPEDHTDPADSWPPILAEAIRQLEEYFERTRTEFDLPLDLGGTTSFQRDVYHHLVQVPHGRLTTYGELAEAVGKPDSARAVGQAVGANPIPIVIPCHRVIASGGRIGGFSGGLPAKVALLGVERVTVDGEGESARVHPEVLRLDL